MTTADRLRQRAREVEDHSHLIRYTHPTLARQLAAISRDLDDLAAHLPPERTEP